MKYLSTHAIIFSVSLLFFLLPAQAADWLSDKSTGCQVWFDDDSALMTAKWSGECRSGKGSGAGILKYFKNGTLYMQYEGSLLNAQYEGRGMLTIFLSGGNVTYKGELSKGMFQGKGAFMAANGYGYVGDFVENQRAGKGVRTYPEGRYEGDWVAGEYQGAGTLLLNTGEKYIGSWLKGKRNGSGVQIFANGDRYQGNYVNDLFSGHGTLNYTQGTYVGEFFGGYFQGMGQYTAKNGAVKKGQFGMYDEAMEEARTGSAGAQASKSSPSNWLGKAIVSIAVVGVVGGSKIDAQSKVKVLTAFGNDMATDGQAQALNQLRAQQASATQARPSGSNSNADSSASTAQPRPYVPSASDKIYFAYVAQKEHSEPYCSTEGPTDTHGPLAKIDPLRIRQDNVPWDLLASYVTKSQCMEWLQKCNARTAGSLCH